MDIRRHFGSSTSFCLASSAHSLVELVSASSEMAPKKAMTRAKLAQRICEEFEIKQKTVAKIITSLAKITAKEVRAAGKITIPGLCRIKMDRKPATADCMKKVFGKMQFVRGKPARTIVKVFPVLALKNSILANIKKALLDEAREALERGEARAFVLRHA